MFDGCFVFWGQDQTGTVGDARQRLAHLIKDGCDVLIVAAKGLIDLLAVVAVQIADLQQAIDKHAQAKLRGDTASTDMGAVKQAKVFQILHHVADRGGRDLFGHRAGQRAGADGIAAVEVALDRDAAAR